MLKVTYETFEHLKTETGKALTDLNTVIEDMKTNINTTLSGTWLGAGHESYVGAQNKWNAAAEDLYQVLLQVQRSLTDCENGFAQYETGVVRMFL